MYNKKWKAWEAPSYEESLLIWCREPFNRENPQALYMLADDALSRVERGKGTAEAVWQMEKAADLGLAQAALAMGQMFQHGWAVHRSGRMARRWYEKAASLGSQEAAAFLAELGKARKRRACLACGAVALAVVLGAGAWTLLRNQNPEGVLVHEDTELLTPVTLDEFTQALQDLVAQYDDAMVVSGQRSTNRLLLRFEGSGIDLSDFPAAVVIADESNYLVVQFETEEEVQRCLESLRVMESVRFADLDEYGFTTGAAAANHTTSGVPYVSPYTGDLYYSWGVEFLGLDQLAAWLKNQPTEPVTVAVLDTGVEPCDENRDCILPGFDVTDPAGNGWADHDGHGTHVAGTVIDCTWGLDVSILPVKVFADEYTSDSYVIQGLQYAIQSGADVINMSLGGNCRETQPDETCGSLIDDFIQEALNQGIVVVAAAGNGDDLGNPVDTRLCCPAHLGDCIVVGACDSESLAGYFSNYGDSVDVAAPGVDVISYFPGGTLQSLDGTSMAAPHISALAAMLKLYLPDKTPGQLEKYIKDYCVDRGNHARYGEGIPWAAFFAGD